jgi:hypothetical protein
MDTQNLITHYTEYVLKHDERPSSVYNFCEHLELEESEFYDHFSSFDQLETEILSRMVDNAIALTVKEDGDNESSSDSKNQLLTFYLTLTEVFKSNRSLVLFLLPQGKKELASLKMLKKSRKSFFDFIKTLEVSPSFMSFIPDVNVKEKTIQAAAWLQFISILRYWLQDKSSGFEKTDIFIEKSLKLSFELSESNVLNSIVDLGKFMINKK